MKEVSVISKSIPAKSRSINYRTGDIAYRQSSSPASVDISGKLDKEIFESVFKLHYDDPDNPNLPTSVESLVGFWTERFMSSMGLNPGTGGGGGGASTLGGLNNVGPWADEVPSADRVMVQLKGATHWASKPLSEIVGLDTEALGNYLTSNNYAKKSDIPSLSGYATEAWVTTKLGSYATASSLKAVSDKLDDFLTGTDTDTVINKWKELEDFLSGFKETDTLAGALALKADKTQLADYVTLGTVQTITANKKFSVDAASVISVDNNANTSTSDYAAIIFRHGGEHIGGIAANKNDNYLYRASVNFTTSYKILDVGNYTETLDSRYVTKAFFSRLFKAHKADGSDIAVNDTDTDIDNIESLVGFWTERFMSSMGMNPGTGGGEGGGIIQSVYGYSDLGKTFSDDNLTDTFNAYTINKLADRLSVVESGAITSVDWGIITGKPNTLAGYDITDAYTKAQADGKYVALAGAQTITGVKTFTKHIMLGGSSYSSINHVFNSDTSSYLNMGFWSNTNNVRVASIGYWNTAERIILNPIGSAEQWENTVGKYNFIVGRNELTYNTYNILHTGNYTGTLDGRYVKKSGDAMTGVLQFSGGLNVKHNNYGITAYAATGSSWEGGYKYYNTAGSAQLGAFGAYGSSNALNYLYIGKSYDDAWLKVTGGDVVPLVVRSTNATGQVIQVCDASGAGAELGWYSDIGAFIQNDRLSSRPTLSLGGVDSLASGLRFRYSGKYYDVWHGGNLPKSSLWAGEQSHSHGVQENVYTPYQFISTFLNNNWAGLARRGSWYYANNGQITTDWGNMHLAGTAYMAWGYNKTRTMLFITPSTRNAGADLTNEMMFYTCNEPNETYPSRWTRVLTSRNYNKYTPTFTGGGASGTWGISVSGNAASATKLQTARTISLIGNASGSASFDGTANVTINVTNSYATTSGTAGGLNIYNPILATSYESNAIQAVANKGLNSINHSIRFNWYSNYWDIGIKRGGSSDDEGFAFYRNGAQKALIDINGNISATGRLIVGYDNSSYKISTSSFICSSWIRTTGATGWYNETYGGGWYMADGAYLRPYNSKIIYSSSGIMAAYSAGSWISMAQRTTCIYTDNNNSASSAHALFRTKWNNGNAMCYGGLGDEMGFYAFPKSYIDNSNNSYSWKTVWSSSGTLTHYGTFRATVGMWTDGYASSLGMNTSSDMRLKNKVRDITIPVRAIAEAPSFEYTWKSGKGGLEAGSSAQYWMNVVTPCVNANPEGYYAMRYGQIALLSCISISKELLKSIGRVESLEDKVKRLEKENRELLEFKRKVEQRLSA